MLLPLRSEAVDLYLDDFSANNCIFTYNRRPTTSSHAGLQKTRR